MSDWEPGDMPGVAENEIEDGVNVRLPVPVTSTVTGMVRGVLAAPVAVTRMLPVLNPTGRPATLTIT